MGGINFNLGSILKLDLLRGPWDTHNWKVSWTSINTAGADGLYSIVYIVSVAVRVFMD